MTLVILRGKTKFLTPLVISCLHGGCTVKEMERNRQQSFSCGAGGGMMYKNVKRGEKINDMRAKKAANTGTSMAIIACPFSLLMFEEAIISLHQSKLAPRDLAEVVNELV
jgi:heterodisulfide reductase subunit D